MAGEPVYPLRVSDNHRYFVDQQGEPVFWMGTTQWQLFREYKLEDARLIDRSLRPSCANWPQACARAMAALT
jgi:hypothetical protein